MSAERHGRLAANFRWLALSYGASKIAALVTVFLLARSLGDDLFGRFAIALAIPLSLEAVADMGLSWALIREGAGRPDRARRLAYVAVGPKVILGALTVAVSYGLARAAGLPDQIVEATLFLALAKAADSLTYLCRAVFQAHERMDYDAAAITSDAALRLILVVYAVVGEFGLVGFAKAYSVSALITLVATAVFCFHRHLRPPEWDVALTGRLFLAGAPLAAVWLLDGLGGRVGIIVVGGLLGDAAAGNFAAALRLLEPLLAIPALMSAAVLPLAARHIVEERATMGWLFEATLKVAVLVASVATVVYLGVGGVLIRLVFGAEFTAARELIGPLSVGLIPLFVHGLLLSFLVALRQQRALLTAQAVGVAANVGVLVALAPALGTLAGAVALVAAEIATVAVAVALVPELRALRTDRLYRLAAVALGSACVLTTTVVLPPVVATALALGALVALVRIARVIDPREIAYIESSSPLLGRLGRAILTG